MKTLVIGATGIIGNHIVRALLKEGHEVIGLSRGVMPSVNLDGLSVTRLKADLLDVKALKEAFKGVDWVFQAAGYYPRDAFHNKQHVAQALAGVRSVIAAALDAGIERLVYTSSLTTIGQASEGGLADESLSYDLLGSDPHPYFLVKHLCEQEVVRAVREHKLPAVIVNPTGCFGPYELKPKSLCLIPHLVSRQMPAFINGKINVVDVADVARGHVLAAQQGNVGERYILGGHNTTVKEMVCDICAVAGVAPPRMTVPLCLGLGVSYISEGLACVTGGVPHFSSLGLRFIQYGQHFSLAKAVRELGYRVSPMAPCFEKAIAWFKRIGYC